MGMCKWFLVCRHDKLLGWLSRQTSVVNFRYYLFCLCNVRRQYLLPGILGIYCFLTGVPSLPAIALPKGRICSLVNQLYIPFNWCHCLLLACTGPMLVKCCAIIFDTLPTLNQHCVSAVFHLVFRSLGVLYHACRAPSWLAWAFPTPTLPN